MPCLRRSILPFVLTALVLVGCRSPKTFDSAGRITVAAAALHRSPTPPARRAVAVLSHADRVMLHRWIVGVWFARWLDGLAAQSDAEFWHCVATAETGGVPALGPTYWTVFGMVTDIIEGYGTPLERAHVFAGTASYAEQVDIASRFERDHGFGGWGYLTRQKCQL